jgi:hypothetical protein
MYLYSGFVPFNHGSTGRTTHNNVFSVVPFTPDLFVVDYPADRTLIRKITCVAALNSFTGGDLAAVDNATAQTRPVVGRNLLVLEASVAAANTRVLRLAYHITVVTLEKVPGALIQLDGNFMTNF